MADSDFLELQDALKGRYSLLRELGRGGMGVVYLAHEVALDRPVAIKLLPPAQALIAGRRERFLREARAAAQLSHPNIVPIHSVEETGRLVFYVMAYIDGETLSARVARAGTLRGAEAAAMLRDLARALGYAHARRIIHRDVKPDNILIERQSGRALLTDFGIARVAEQPGETGAGLVVGTPEYLSPEQAGGGVLDGRSDLYALGAVAFFALSGRPPFTGDNAGALIAQHIAHPAPVLASLAPGAPPRVAAIAQRCLAKTPEERFASGEELAEALDSALDKPRQLPAILERWVRGVGQLRFRHVLLAPALLWPTLDLLRLLTDSLFPGSQLGDERLMIGLVFVAPFAVYGIHRLRQVRRARAAGYALEDLRAALRQELAREREEVVTSITEKRGVIGRLMGALPGMAVAALGVLTLNECFNPASATASDFLYPVWIALAGAVLAARMSHADGTSPEILDLESRSRLWQAWPGRLMAYIAGFGRRRLSTPAVLTHRPTELALGGAAAALFEALPRELRRELRDVPGLIGKLENQATKIRERIRQLGRMESEAGPARAAPDERHARAALELDAARKAAERRQADLIAALETIRLDLIRLHAGTMKATGFSADLSAARGVSAGIDAMVEGHDAVRRMMEPAPTPT